MSKLLANVFAASASGNRPFNSVTSSSSSSSCTHRQTVIQGITAVAASSVLLHRMHTPLSNEAQYLLDVGDRVIGWIGRQYDAKQLMQAWEIVKKFVHKRSDRIYQTIRAHPLLATLGIAAIASLTLLFLLRRVLQDFVEANQAHLTAHFEPPNQQLMAALNEASFVCPITLEVMEDPVVTPSGHTYERAALVDWLGRNGTDPVTFTPLSADELVPNRAIKDAIVQWKSLVQSDVLTKKC